MPLVFRLAGRAVRVARNTARRAENPRLCLHHIPKCAGTSLIAAVEDEYMRLRNYPRLLSVVRMDHAPMDRLIQLGEADVSEQALLYHLAEGPDFLFGHVPFSERAYAVFRDQYAFLTVLRDPVDRFLSQFFYTRRRYPERLGPGPLPDLAEFVETPLACSYGSTIVSYLTGRHSSVLEPPTSERIARAIDNLQKFTLVGRAEDMPAFERSFREHFRVQLRIDRLNTSSALERPSVNGDLRRRVEALCAPDIEVYETMAGGSRA